MRLNHTIPNPGTIETIGDVISILAQHQVGSVVYVVKGKDKSISRVLIRSFNIEVLKDSSVTITYVLANPNDPVQSQSSPITMPAGSIYGTLEEAAAAAWGPNTRSL